MLTGYVTYVASRWRDFLVNCHKLQGRIHDIALTCGKSAQAPVKEESRRKLFKIYRYLSAIHALTYHTVSPSLRSLSLEGGDFDRLGLLTMREAKRFLPMDNKIRDTLLTWLGSAVDDYINHELSDPAPVINILTAKVCDLRSVCSRHHDMMVRGEDYHVQRLRAHNTCFENSLSNLLLFFNLNYVKCILSDNSNAYVRLLLVVVTIWLAAFIAVSPFEMTIYTPGAATFLQEIPCFQPFLLVGNMVLLFTIVSTITMIRALRNPFAHPNNQEFINVDGLLASTERCMFASLRAKFDDLPEETAVDSVRGKTRNIRRRATMMARMQDALRSSSRKSLPDLKDTREI